MNTARQEFKEAQSLDALALKKKYSNEPFEKVVKDWEARLVLATGDDVKDEVKGDFIQKHKLTFDEIQTFFQEAHDWTESKVEAADVDLTKTVDSVVPEKNEEAADDFMFDVQETA